MRLHLPVFAAVLLLAGNVPAQTAHHKAAATNAAPAQSIDQMVAAANAEKALLKSIYQAPTDQSLADKHPRSRIGAMVLAAKQYELHPATGGPAVLAALPRNQAEIEAFHRFCDADTDISAVERYFYGVAMESVKRHPETLLLVLHDVAASYAVDFPGQPTGGSWYCSELAQVRAAMPQQYDGAVKRAPEAERDYLQQCGAGS